MIGLVTKYFSLPVSIIDAVVLPAVVVRRKISFLIHYFSSFLRGVSSVLKIKSAVIFPLSLIPIFRSLVIKLPSIFFYTSYSYGQANVPYRKEAARVCGCVTSFRRIPGMFLRWVSVFRKPNSVPEGVGKTTEEVSKTTEEVSQMMKRISKTTERGSKMPEESLEMPKRGCETAETVGETPEKLCKATEECIKMEKTFCKIPERFSKTSEGFSGKPEGFCETENGFCEPILSIKGLILRSFSLHPESMNRKNQNVVTTYSNKFRLKFIFIKKTKNFFLAVPAEDLNKPVNYRKKFGCCQKVYQFCSLFNSFTILHQTCFRQKAAVCINVSGRTLEYIFSEIKLSGHPP